MPLRWWAIATMFLASVLLAFLVALPAEIAFAATAALAAVAVGFFLSYGGARISLLDGELRAGQAHIPVRLLADPVVLDEEETRRAVGVRADARAYLVLRAYLPEAVRVRVVDPADPTPYWLLSTRHPRTLAEELRTAIAAAGTGGVSAPIDRAD